MVEVFLDTAYAIALSSPTDNLHLIALELAKGLETSNVRLVTTHAVIFEIGNALSRQRYRKAAVSLLDALEADPKVEVIPVSEALLKSALRLYRGRNDKSWGLTDCISFIVMRERGITGALTPDEHFQQAGFRALMREGYI